MSEGLAIDRRAAAAGLLAALGLAMADKAQAAVAAGLQFGPPRPFSFEALKSEALARSRRAYTPPAPAPAVLDRVDYDAVGQIDYRPENTLWGDLGGDTAVRLFHMGRYASDPVTIHVLENGQARQLRYAESLFSMPASLAAQMRDAPLGFAGFRAMTANRKSDWVAFQGASYFRAAGPFDQYGLSARGLAVDTVVAGRAEEFPRFTGFWLEQGGGGELVVYAVLESPSVEGAYRIAHRRQADGTVVQEIEAALYIRAAISRLGVAPLTSMYWYGQNDRRAANDWRPQIHDSDGLAMWTGAGERLWRPLLNPPHVIANAFQDDNPRGFGLMQRDRAFEDYQDDGVFYEKRPSVWVEPIGGWGRGSVQLAEIPTEGETEDNIVAFWTPAAPVAAGQAFDLRYRLYWSNEEPQAPGVARVVATRRGRGGRPGHQAPPGTAKFVIDFSGPNLAGLTRSSGVEAVVTLGGTAAADAVAYPVVSTDRWRLMFDLPFGGKPQVECRAFLRRGGQSLTETWTYLALA